MPAPTLASGLVSGTRSSAVICRPHARKSPCAPSIKFVPYSGASAGEKKKKKKKTAARLRREER
jgi:hypothetical protein